MSEDTKTMFEMTIQAERLCSALERLADDLTGKEREELRLKLSQCRNALLEVKQIYDDESLTVRNVRACSHFRQIIMALMWSVYYTRRFIDYRLFRKLVVLESSFSYLLMARERRLKS